MDGLTNTHYQSMVFGQSNSSVGIGIPNIQGVPAPFERVFYAIFRYGEGMQGHRKVGRFLDTVMPILHVLIAREIGISSDEFNTYQGKPSWRIRLKSHLNFHQNLSLNILATTALAWIAMIFCLSAGLESVIAVGPSASLLSIVIPEQYINIIKGECYE